jgi:hypothetical protein
MNFKPHTEQEIADGKLWAKGVYPFEILDAFEKTSKAGHPMIELKIRIASDKGSRIIPDYLLEQTPEKLRHACAACGLLEKYETGCLSNDDFVGKQGRLKLSVEKARNGYPAKNVVADYQVASEPSSIGDLLSRSKRQ